MNPLQWLIAAFIAAMIVTQLSSITLPFAGVAVFLLLVSGGCIAWDYASSSEKNFWRYLTREFASGRVLQNGISANLATKLVFVQFVIVSLSFTFRSLTKYWALKTAGFDMGLFLNTIYRLAFMGDYLNSIKGGMNLYLDHQSPILVGFAALFRLLPYAETILIAQALILASGAFAVYLLVLQHSPGSYLLAAVVSFVYSVTPAVRAANAFHFHPEIVILPAALFTIVGLQSTKRWAQYIGWMMLLICLAGKETASFVVVGIGLSWLAGAGVPARRDKLRVIGIWFIVIGSCLFVFNSKLVPWLLGGKGHSYLGMYAHLGASYLEIALSPILRPEVFWGMFLDGYRQAFALYIFAPCLFLCFLPLRALPIVLLPMAPLFLSMGQRRFIYDAHYGIELTVGVFWGLCMAIPLIRRFSIAKFGTNLLLAILGLALTLQALHSIGRSDIAYARKFRRTMSKVQYYYDQVLPCIDKKAHLAASSSVVSSLAMRPWVLELHNTEWSKGPNIQCFVLDRSTRPLYSALTQRSITRWLRTNQIKQVKVVGDFEVYQRLDQPGLACWQCDTTVDQ